MKLAQLCRAIDARLPAGAEEVDVRAVRDDSRAVRPGDLFVAVRGEEEDGRSHASEAVSAGAVAVVADVPLELAVPVVVVDDARRALAALAAESLGHPASRLWLAGITGTIGKTSVLMMLTEILAEAGIRAGSVGSLGIEHPGGEDTTANTTPGALTLQHTMAEMVEEGTRVMAMEVTSHALEQGRVHGVSYDLGVFTNLAMLEHMEYHGTFAAYVAAKRLFLEHLEPGAPLIYAAGNPTLRQLLRAHSGPLIGCGGGGSSHVVMERGPLRLECATLTLRLQRPLPRLGDEPLAPNTLELELRTPGRAGMTNAALAAVAALCLGAPPDAVRTALRGHEPPPRRFQLIRRADPAIIDDTVGHPDSISGVFEVVARVPHRRLNVAFCIRGRRGPTINEHDAQALAIWSRQVRIDALHVTSAEDCADERNTVSDEERRAFLEVLRSEGIPHTHHARLSDAIDATLSGSGAGDLVLLLGAQGMDAGAALARQWFGQCSADRISSE